MSQKLKNIVVKIEDTDGNCWGTGFVVANDLVVTCAHVAGKVRSQNQQLCFSFCNLSETRDAIVDEYLWSDSEDGGVDVAFLRFAGGLPAGVQVARLGVVQASMGKVHEFRAFGFPNIDSKYSGIGAHGDIVEETEWVEGHPMLQLNSDEIKPGMSGAPVLDLETDLIVGMISEYDTREIAAFRFAIPTETLVNICKTLTLSSPLPAQISTDNELNQLVSGYLEEVRDDYLNYWYQHVSTAGGYSPISLPRPVGQLFFSDRLREKPTQKKSQRANGETQLQVDSEQIVIEKVPDKKEKQAALLEFSTLRSIFMSLCAESLSQGALLLAEPGAGKTLSLRHLAAEQAVLAERLDQPIPLSLSLNEYTGGSLFDFIYATLTSNSSAFYYSRLADNLELVLQKHSILLLLDGLNEVAELPETGKEQQQKFLVELSDFSRRPHLIYIIASRETPETTRLSLPKISLRPFNQLGIAECLNLYTPEYTAEIMEALDTNPALRELATNPYRVKAISQIYRPGMEIPTSPGILFETLVRMSVEREAARRTERELSWKPFEDWSPFLCLIARILTERGTTVLHLQELKVYGHDSDMLEFAAGSGLIQPPTQTISFVHQQMQEYFAALWLKSVIQSKGLEAEEFSQVLNQSTWDEVFYLLAGIIPNHFLDNLIQLIAEVDPFLAARCVGLNPQKVSGEVRGWLAKYLGRGLLFANSNKNRELFDKLLQALGETRSEESFEILIRPVVVNASEAFYRPVPKTGVPPEDEPLVFLSKSYYEAISKIDTQAAAEFIVQQLRKAIAREDRYNRSDYTVFTQALANMKTPYARAFLVQNLYNINIYPAVLKAIGAGRIREAAPRLRAMLSIVNPYADPFKTIVQTIGRAGLTELIPDLLAQAGSLSVVETLLRFDAGQDMIDSDTDYQRFLARLRVWRDDFDLFGIPIPGYYSDSWAKLWYWLDRNLGQEVSEEYLDLLIVSATTAHEYVNRRNAVYALALVRYAKALPALKKLFSTPLPISDESKTSYSDNTESNRDELVSLLERVIEFFETKAAAGASQRSLDRFALSIRRIYKRLGGEEISTKPAEILAKAYSDPQKMVRLATLSLQSKEVDYWHLAFYLSALQFLIDSDWPLVGREIINLLVQFVEAYRAGHENSSKSAWHLAHLAVCYGQRGSFQRKEVLKLVAPLVFAVDKTLRAIALEILTELNGHEYCAQWLEYLNDKTWSTAYAVVDALGRINVPAAVCLKLVDRLNSYSADKRFFAVLALGNIGRDDYLPQLLKLSRDSNPQVRWALAWAVSNIGRVTPEVTQYLSSSLKSLHSRTRLEAAHAVGALRLGTLGAEVAELLDDYDLRVATQAAWTLGELRDADFVPDLLATLSKLRPAVNTFSSQAEEHRLEDKLVATTAIALGKIKAGVPINVLEKLLENEAGLKILVISHLLRGSWKPLYARLDANDELETIPTDPDLTARLAKMEGLSEDELKKLAYSANHPLERQRAIQLLDKRLEDVEDFLLNELDLRYRHSEGRPEPSPEVEIEFCKTVLKRREFISRSDSRFLANPEYGLQIAKECIDDLPEVANAISFPSGWSSNTSLWLARTFPGEYKIDQLLDALLVNADAGNFDQYIMKTLGELLERSRLPKVLAAWRRSYYYSSHSLESVSLLPLVRRKLWGLVPDLVELLNYDKAVTKVVHCLCELGVYQAANLIQTAIAREKQYYDHELHLASITAKVELESVVSDIVPPHLFEEKIETEPHLYGWFFTVSDILCEIESETASREWARIQCKLFSIPELGVVRCLERGLRHWGISAIRVLFEELATDTNAVEELGSVFLTSQKPVYVKLEGVGGVILQYAKKYSEASFVEWLHSEVWSVRSLTLCLLAGRGSKAIEKHIATLLLDDDYRVVLTVFKCARKGLLPILTEATGAGSGGEPKASQEPESRYKPLSISAIQSIEKYLISSTKDIQLKFIPVIGEFGLRQCRQVLIEVADNEDDDIAVEALQAIRKLGDRKLGAKIAKHLDSKNTKRLIAAIEAVAVLRYRPAANAVIELLEHPDIEIRDAAAGACGLMGIRRAAPQLQHMLSELGKRLSDEDNGQNNVSYTERETEQTSKKIVERVLLMLHPEPRWPLEENFSVSFGEGLLGFLFCSHTLSSQHGSSPFYFLNYDTPFDNYPLPLLNLPTQELIKHAIWKDLRSTPWVTRKAKKAVFASLSLGSLDDDETINNEMKAFDNLEHLALLLRVSPSANELVEAINILVSEIVRAIQEEISKHWISERSGESLKDLWDRIKTTSEVEGEEIVTTSWDDLSSFLEAVVNLQVDEQYRSMADMPPEDLHSLGGILWPLAMDEPLAILAEIIALEDTPDYLFLEKIQRVARLCLAKTLVFRWGCLLLLRLRSICEQADLGNKYIAAWSEHLWWELSPESVGEYVEQEPVRTKTNPIAAVLQE